MSLGFCPTCLAAEEAGDEALSTLVRRQAVKLDQLRSELFPLQVQLGAARDRIRELEEIIDRQQKKILRTNRRVS